MSSACLRGSSCKKRKGENILETIEEEIEKQGLKL